VKEDSYFESNFLDKKSINSFRAFAKCHDKPQGYTYQSVHEIV